MAVTDNERRREIQPQAAGAEGLAQSLVLLPRAPFAENMGGGLLKISKRW
jgi:hypothetical protein